MGRGVGLYFFLFLLNLNCLQAALKKSNLELESELMVKLNNIEMMNEAAEMKDKIIKVTIEIKVPYLHPVMRWYFYILLPSFVKSAPIAV